MTQDAETLAALSRIDDAQAALARLLRPVDAALLRARPPSGEWSPMEHLRHLVFAEQHHFKPYLERGFRWSSAGVPPPNNTGERRLTPVGSDPATGIGEVFDAWAKVHDVVRGLALASADDLTRQLKANLNHVMIHMRVIQELVGSERRARGA